MSIEPPEALIIAHQLWERLPGERVVGPQLINTVRMQEVG